MCRKNQRTTRSLRHDIPDSAKWTVESHGSFALEVAVLVVRPVGCDHLGMDEKPRARWSVCFAAIVLLAVGYVASYPVYLRIQHGADPPKRLFIHRDDIQVPFYGPVERWIDSSHPSPIYSWAKFCGVGERMYYSSAMRTGAPDIDHTTIIR